MTPGGRRDYFRLGIPVIILVPKYKKALGNEIAGASDNKVPINSSVRKLMTSEERCTRKVITDKVSSA